MTSHSFPYFSLFRPPWESCFPPPLSLLPIPTLFSPSYLLPCPPPPSETEKNEDVTFFTLPSGRGLVIPIFFPCFFFVVTCPRLPVFVRSNKYSLSFATRARTCISSDLNNCVLHPEGGRTTTGSNAPGAFLVT